jgi:drug/metabolite transporter (DMT)-like permease
LLDSIAFALAAALFWGLADFGAGFKSRELPVVTVLLGVQWPGLLISAALVLASGTPLPGTKEVLASLGAGVAGTAGLALFYRALASGTMSIVAPIGASGVALPVLVGVLGGDHLRAAQALGLVVAVVGVVLSSLHANAGEDREHARLELRAIAFAVLAAVGFGCYFIGSHTGVRGGVAWMLLLSHAVAFAGLLAVAMVVRAPLLSPRRDRLLLGAYGLLDMTATGLYALANRHGLLSVVAVVGSLYPAATIALARVTLHERVGPLAAAGVALALGGVLLIAGG